jgi:hypothetical protein
MQKTKCPAGLHPFVIQLPEEAPMRDDQRENAFKI